MCISSTKKSTNKIEKIQELCPKLLYNSTTESYGDLLIKTLQLSMEIKRLRTLATEIFKKLNDISPNFMKKIICLSPHETHKKCVLFFHSRNTTKYGNHSLRVLGPHIWKYLELFTRKNKATNYFH